MDNTASLYYLYAEGEVIDDAEHTVFRMYTQEEVSLCTDVNN